MGLDYSQKRLVSAPFRGGKKRSKKEREHAERLQLYAFWTGFLSTLISLTSVIIQALHPR